MMGTAAMVNADEAMPAKGCVPVGTSSAARLDARNERWPTGQKTTVVVPAFNEESFIGNLVRQIRACQRQGVVHELIVVSDGSTDQTAAVARAEGAAVIELKRNRGKSWAVAAGAHACRGNGSSIMLMLDADLQSIEPGQLASLIAPLHRTNAIDMVIGTVKDDLAGLSGQRAIRMRAMAPLFCNSGTWRKKLFVTGYGLEVALHHLLKRQEIVATEFVPARPAEGKRLGVRQQVDAADRYISERNALALLLRERRGQIASLPMAERCAVRRRLLGQARDLERRCYESYVLRSQPHPSYP